MANKLKATLVDLDEIATFIRFITWRLKEMKEQHAPCPYTDPPSTCYHSTCQGCSKHPSYNSVPISEHLTDDIREMEDRFYRSRSGDVSQDSNRDVDLMLKAAIYEQGRKDERQKNEAN